MKKIIILLAFILLVFPFQQNIKAETVNPIQQDYIKYDSFQKRYHDFMGELSYYMSVSYNSNDHYFQENMDRFRQSLTDAYGENYFTQDLLESANELFAKPVAFLSTLPDLRRFMWDKIKGFFSNEEQENEQYLSGVWQYVGTCEGYPTYQLTSDFMLISNLVNSEDAYSQLRLGSTSVILYPNGTGCNVSDHNAPISYVTDNSLVEKITRVLTNRNVRVVTRSSMEDVNPINVGLPQEISNVYNRTINNFNDGERFDPDYSPDVVPVLVCPEEQSIDLSYQDGLFYTKQRSNDVILINPDETVHYNGMDCRLDFKFPTLELEPSGAITANGESIVRVPTLPIEPPNDYDNTILGYIRNSYEYATSVVSSGVNGLKSIVAGTTGLITFTGSLFGFLPPEILTLFIGGFSIALGLWVFKK